MRLAAGSGTRSGTSGSGSPSTPWTRCSSTTRCTSEAGTPSTSPPTWAPRRPAWTTRRAFAGGSSAGNALPSEEAGRRGGLGDDQRRGRDRRMQLGMIGLGRMGANLVRRLMRGGHECVVYDVNPAAVKELAGEGATGASSLEEFVAKLTAPRAAWVMVPAAFTGQTVTELAEKMQRGDIIVDGGNSYYRDDIERAKALEAGGIHFVDGGTSGGVFGLERGFCLMIGGEREVVDHLDPIFATIAPGAGSVEPTPGRDGKHSTSE